MDRHDSAAPCRMEIACDSLHLARNDPQLSDVPYGGPQGETIKNCMEKDGPGIIFRLMK